MRNPLLAVVLPLCLGSFLAASLADAPASAAPTRKVQSKPRSTGESKAHSKVQSRKLASAHHARPPAPRFPAVSLAAPNVRETLTFRPYDERGRARPQASKELARFLRDARTGKKHTVDPRLGKLIYAIARHYQKPLEIFSGYRPTTSAELLHSRHRTASAIDFHVPGVTNEALVRWVRESFHPVGVGYYPGGQHVHLDVDRAEDTYWVDQEQPLGTPRRTTRPSLDEVNGGAPDPGMPVPPSGYDSDEDDELPGLRSTVDPGIAG